MNNVVADRVEGDLGKWLKREQRFQKIFPGPLAENRSFLKEKLKYYRTLDSRYGNIANQEERTTLRLVREDRKAIERQLYPNAFARLAYRAYSRIQNEAKNRQDKRRNESNLEGLKATALRLGFPEDALIKGQREGRSENPGKGIPFSYQMAANERMAFHWNLKNEEGSFTLKGYKATLSKEGEPDRSHNFDFNGTDGITGAQAYNLLSGRSVEIGKEGNRHWIKLDLNDKNLNGDHRVKRFYPNYHYSLREELAKLPLKPLTNALQTELLEEALRNGERKEIILSNGKRLAIEADPQYKTLNCYQDGQKISLRQAVKGKRGQNNKHWINDKLRKELDTMDRRRIGI